MKIYAEFFGIPQTITFKSKKEFDKFRKEYNFNETNMAWIENKRASILFSRSIIHDRATIEDVHTTNEILFKNLQTSIARGYYNTGLIYKNNIGTSVLKAVKINLTAFFIYDKV
jgi:hypothetical protein